MRSSPRSLSSAFYSEGVEFKPLGEVADYVRGITYDKSQELKDPKESLNSLKVLRANNIDVDFNRLNFNEVKLLIDSIPVKPAQYLSKNDIFICAGSGSREHIGKVAFIDENLDYIFGGFMAVIRVFSRDINPRFLFHTLCSQFFRDYIAGEIDSTTINNLSSSIVRNFPIPIPPLSIQKRIVEILDKFTELIATLDTELTLREKQYTYYLNQLLDFGTPENPREGVEFKRLDEVAKYANGAGHEKFIREDSLFVLINSRFISTKGETKKYVSKCFCHANYGDIALVLSDLPKGKALGKCFFIDRDNYYAINQRICKISVFSREIDSKFLYYYMDRNHYF